ncbi:uracil-DNA glycosylase family protein [Leptolyngbya sp. FACHB-261]|uniref:uracil-DNA glycosylase n=1 Tax=Leptolyngbya sp. FACHB-261 TaxID=2692806 RepID=UPI0016848983|nr:uracil-DNA glycosylase [Leptolyngbya sp. FACHB-261]MBD2104922.1 uracil-DNA glycosylase [Leptolyngbya sp. FACHB-261]
MSLEEQISLFGQSEPAAATNFDPELIPTDGSLPIPPGSYSDIATIVRHCNSCVRCELAAGRTHAVVGRGSENAKIMIVGEGPGQHEDETGIPFVGRSGQLLEKILESVRLTEDDVYISNIVKCRPPGNRTPTTEEADICKGYLLEQIRMIDPKIILLTGATAVRSLTGNKQGITKIRGEWLSWNGRDCMPIFHPAYLLRNPSRDKGSPKWLMWQDIQKVRQRYDELMAEAAV